MENTSPHDQSQDIKENSNDNWLSSDRPIRLRNQDRLGRRRFAEAIASAIQGWRGQDSLVLALYGHWGSGKSSVKNMVIDALKDDTDKPVIVAEFNPWEFANREQLSAAFFDQIGIALGRGTIGSEKHRRNILNRWKRYAAYLQASGALVEVLKGPLRWLLIIAGVLFTGSVAVGSFWAALAVGIIVLIVGCLLFSAKVSEIVTNFLQIGVDIGKKSLEEVKGELANEMRTLDGPILIILDDLDRLTPNEVQEMLQLVKANADFPNLVYLTLCERGIIEKHIEKALEVNGRDYLEKIVQVGFDMPVIERPRLRKILFQELDRVLADEAVAKRFDRQRWGNLFLGALQGYFETLRDVNRFLATLAFHVAVFKGERSFEVNPIDLIGLEVLRLFEPDVYRGLPLIKELLVDMRRHDSREEAEAKPVLENVINKADERNREHVRQIIKQLFPSVEWAIGGTHYSGDFEERWFRDLRVCSKDIFDRYFSFAIPEGDISQSTLDRLMTALGERDTIRQEFRILDSQGLLKPAIERLEAYKETIPLQYALPFVTALFDIGERLADQREGMFEISTEMHAMRVIYWYLRREPNVEVRLSILREAIGSTEGLSLPVSFVALEEQAAAKPESATERLLSDDGLAELKAICVTKIRTAAANGSLAESPHLISILYRWRQWDGPEKPREFCEQLITTPRGVLQLLKGFLSRSISHGIGDYVTRDRWYIRLTDIENFVRWEQIEEKMTDLSTELLDDQERRALEAFKKAVERRRQGKPDSDGFRHLDDE